MAADSKAVRDGYNYLVESLRLRVLDVPVPPQASSVDARVAVLFSGGLDCTILARLSHEVVPSGQAIDLLNVAFENPRIAAQNPDLSQDDLFEKCPDRCTGRSSFAELIKVCPDRPWRFVTVSEPGAKVLLQNVDPSLGKCAIYGDAGP